MKADGHPNVTIENRVTAGGGTLQVRGQAYVWHWSRADDRLRIEDAEGRTIVAGRARPVVTAHEGGGQAYRIIAGEVAEVEAGELEAGELETGELETGELETGELEGAGARISITYADPHSPARLTTTWRFEPEHVWLDPIGFEAPGGAGVVTLHYFADVRLEPPGLGNPSGDVRTVVPTLRSTYLVQPGASASPTLGPVVDAVTGLTVSSWIGRGSSLDPATIHGQWGLPVHYFGGLSLGALSTQPEAFGRLRSDAFCAGLADLPSGDLKMAYVQGNYAPIVDYREDLWGPPDATDATEAAEATGATETAARELGATWFFSFARDYREAIRAYYRGLRERGRIAMPQRSAKRSEVLVGSQFNTWGAQAGRGRQWADFDQDALTGIYQDYRDSGMRARSFVIDDKWEGRYGLLEHDEKRFPDFEATLDRIREDGHAVGLWAAFLRCEDPALMGLTEAQMLQTPNGAALRKGGRDGTYFLFDITRPEVAEVLRERARAFVRRYRPDFVKFDFGYELPSVASAGPADRSWAGERMLQKGLEIVIGAMREVDPDIVVMYYCLSPLFGEHIDLHGLDDLWLAVEEYAQEANRRLFFSSLLAEVGVPTYGSAGYDWTGVRQIWFDSIASGSVGSLQSFTGGDAYGSGPTPADIAAFNGLAALTRVAYPATVRALRHPIVGQSTAARSSSWARYESGALVLAALRPVHFDGSAGVTELDGVLSTSAQVVVAASVDSGAGGEAGAGVGGEAGAGAGPGFGPGVEPAPGVGIGAARRLAVVAYGSGELRVRMPEARGVVVVTAHGLGGMVERSTLPVVDNWVRVSLRTELSSGTPIERLELDLA